MKVKIITVSILLLTLLCGNAQTQFKVAEQFYSSLPDSLTKQIINSLDKLLTGINSGKIDTALIDCENADLNRNFFRNLEGVEDKDTVQKYFRATLINLYPVENSQCLLTVSYTKNDEIGRILTFLVKIKDKKVFFANPVKYNTKYWKTTTVGTVTYYFQDTVDTKRAEIFNQKNILMARKLNLPVRNWDVYMCQNYQEANQIQGCFYEFTRNGSVNSGKIIDPKTLFSVMSDEDFSHDVLHMYAAQIRKNDRNFVAECGIAYYWGNAYHTGVEGKSPDLDELIPVLQRYIQSHKDVKLLELFEKSPNALAEYGYPWPVHVNRIISGIICREIEKKKGVEGIIELMNCGKGYDNLFKSIEKLTGINRNNFDKEVYKLIFSR